MSGSLRHMTVTCFAHIKRHHKKHPSVAVARHSTVIPCVENKAPQPDVTGPHPPHACPFPVLACSFSPLLTACRQAAMLVAPSQPLGSPAVVPSRRLCLLGVLVLCGLLGLGFCMHARAPCVQCCGDSMGVANACNQLQCHTAVSQDSCFRVSGAAAYGLLYQCFRVSTIPSLPQMHCQSLQCVLLQARLCAPVALTAAVLNPIDSSCSATELVCVATMCPRRLMV